MLCIHAKRDLKGKNMFLSIISITVRDIEIFLVSNFVHKIICNLFCFDSFSDKMLCLQAKRDLYDKKHVFIDYLDNHSRYWKVFDMQNCRS